VFPGIKDTGSLQFPRTPLLGNPVNRGNGAAPLVQRLYETSHSFTILLYKTSYYTKVEAMNSAPNVGTHRADGASGATGYLEVERTSTVAGFRFLERECERKWLKED
jgi:hypothetical protein